MSALWLDYRQDKPLHWAGPVLLMLVLAALAATVVHYLALHDETVLWEDRLARAERDLGRERGIRAVHRPGGRDGESLEVKRANEVLRRLSLPWDSLFLTMESAAGEDVALLALEPDAEKQMVKVSGEARDFTAVLNYVTRLEAQEAFGQVYLQSHQVQLQDPQLPVRFALQAVWKGAP